MAEQHTTEREGEAEEIPGGVDSRQDMEQLQAELAEARDKILRAQADLENFRKRSRRELEDERRYANVPLLKDLLPVVDNIDRAVEAAQKSPDASSLLEGVKLVKQQLAAVLQRHHCVELAAQGEPFDPNLHEALTTQPSAEHEPNTVLMVVQPGYQVQQRVIRPSQVIVSTKPES